MGKFEKVAKAAREHGLKAAQQLAAELGVGLYQSAQWPNTGEVWAVKKGKWVRQLGSVRFCDQPSHA